MQRAFVTGGSGFVGGALITTLRDYGTPIFELNLGSVPSAKIYEWPQKGPQKGT